MHKLKIQWLRYGHQVVRIGFFALFAFAAYGIVQDHQISFAGQFLVWPIAFLLWLFLAVQIEPQYDTEEDAAASTGSVVVNLKLNEGEFGSEQERNDIHALSDKLDEEVMDKNVGEYDGDEFGNGECELYFFSEDPERLYTVIKPFLEQSGYAKTITINMTKSDGTELDEISLY